ncbi:HAD family hydrolase [Streptomyces bluensis]|uniref:HAD family hydrolase n=1 Tax=Streptomyces bluensis TaxID=33897 RepID=A0ABW6UAL0_9ACTN
MTSFVGFEAIAVDWAGTLTGTRHRPDAGRVRQVLHREFGIDVPHQFVDLYDRLFWSHYERSLADSLACLLVEVAVETGIQLPDLDSLTQALWDDCGDHDPDPAAVHAVRHLHDRYQVPMWLASNTCRPVERRKTALDRAGLSFVSPLCSSDIGVAKPEPAYYQELIQRAGVPAERILFIGDHLVPDVLGPAQAGMRTVWIHGSTSHEELGYTVPDSTIRVPHLSYLPALLEEASR